MEFHISRWVRDRCNFDQGLFSFTGNVIFANFHAARVFARKLNAFKEQSGTPERTVKASEINAMGLVDEILHYVFSLYRRDVNPVVLNQAYAWLVNQLGRNAVDQTIREFCQQFPPVDVYTGRVNLDAYLNSSTDGVPNHVATLEEILLLWIANKNPAFDPFQELFDDRLLDSGTAYPKFISSLQEFFISQPPFGPDQENLIDMLRRPAVIVPHSIPGQLEYIRVHWASLLGNYLSRLLSSLDLVREEEKAVFFGPGLIAIPTYDRAAAAAAGEMERFSPDRDWMPNLVLIAKNTHVWLDQLSKKYGHLISTLDQIPDEELDQLARWGISGLWLIGVWERSAASARIKQLCGNPEALASAYSLSGYWIAADLGGQQALENLRGRAWQRGIRLASDMVPNHMGIDSSWVTDHPDWFISLDYSPFPSYTFNGPDLSSTGRVSIQIEDHYYTRSDAAVVFKWTDRQTGHTQYIYHGNDGTSMPWNDTAQLNYLKKEVREAVIQTILQVARQFPIIRFDAAMTLTKKHFQRLWFPEPGSGGDIPTRSDFGMTKSQFDEWMGEEFWREVVDRVAREIPDTLLLAEAFWLMESYFVRSLGMHRVYNSAFMNLLRDEDNAKYRQLLKNTLEFDPEILKRYVNFMNNPDERTAVDQFGKGDKYFGICTLMATLPGLPMLGHGQVEGFSEKYGMEYRKAYWNETADPALVERHEREIFPLLHRRAIFAGVENFLLFDFYTESGEVNEDVYAYTNGMGDSRALVIYHNRFASSRGWLHTSAAFSIKKPEGRTLVQKTIADGLNLKPAADRFVLFRDLVTGLNYIRSSKSIAEKGLFFDLAAYQAHVWVDFHEITDDPDESYRKLHDSLEGRGVNDIQAARQELLLQPVLSPFRQIANPGFFQGFLQSAPSGVCSCSSLPPELLDETAGRIKRLLDGACWFTGLSLDYPRIVDNALAGLELALALPALESFFPLPPGKIYDHAARYLKEACDSSPNLICSLLGWIFTRWLDDLPPRPGKDEGFVDRFETWQLSRELGLAYQGLGLSAMEAARCLAAIRILARHQTWMREVSQTSFAPFFENLLRDEEICAFLRIHTHQGIEWFNKEAFGELIALLLAAAALSSAQMGKTNASRVVETVMIAWNYLEKALLAEEISGYQVDLLVQALNDPHSGVNPGGHSSSGRALDDG